MKKLLALAFLLLTGAGFAQQEWAPVGAKWIFDVHPFPNPGIGYTSVIVEKDTTINGIACKKLYGEYVCPWSSGAQYTYESNDTVYLFSPNSNKFEMIYDFGANAGDTWNIACFPQVGVSNTDTIRVVVDSVKNVIISGVTLRAIYFTQTNDDFYWMLDSPVIEKIGSPVLLPGSPNCDGRVGSIRCYEDNLIEYHVGNIPCYYSTIGLESYHIKEVALHPNPATDYVQLVGEFSDHLEYIIYDLKGQIVLQNIYTGSPIDIIILNKGMYILKLVNDNNHIPFIKL